MADTRLRESDRFLVRRALTQNGVNVWVIRQTVENGATKHYIAKPVELEFEELWGGNSEPVATLFIPLPFNDEGKALKSLTNGLLELDGKVGHEELMMGQMKAMEGHLNDMRAIAMYKVGVPKP